MLKSFFIIYSILQLLTGTHCDISNNIVSKLLVDMTKFETIQKNYDRNGPSVEVVKVSLDEVTNVAITLSRKLQNYREEFKTLLNPDDVLWAREANKSETDKSFVHIPIDIFREEKDIMEAITWTSLLDPLWDDLLNTFTEIKLQFFGSTTGVMRYFPGDKWTSRELDKDEKPIDLYDVRRRTWYIEGMSTPKVVLILIDSSGSSQGQALALMKHMSKQLLDTLTENDFFDVLNKSWEYIEAMTSLGIANFTRALENAFILFNNTASYDESNRLFGPHCNKMIMLLTDGGNEKPADLLRTYNKYLQIRIFTYLIGPISTHAPAIKWIAEKNRGKFYQIPSIVAIRSQTQDYIRFLADSKAQSNNWLTMTTARYDQMSNDLVLTLVYPLFNMSHGQERMRLLVDQGFTHI
ncbi:hypothetical protein HELRODRAFT_175161 [Helobdella robusta]|uniref:VWFA domain-containing protein n=1 Tax=Helobdella robusta TaxID=6412 RepID=T1F8X8_HELRO|nr:hypothetical protein HELRODRAFT_175161 [Helobdella robusta]ESO01131.1 hypothetical protein HELRODRAFT_175161 [Helobdella robusta]